MNRTTQDERIHNLEAEVTKIYKCIVGIALCLLADATWALFGFGQ